MQMEGMTITHSAIDLDEYYTYKHNWNFPRHEDDFPHEGEWFMPRFMWKG